MVPPNPEPLEAPAGEPSQPGRTNRRDEWQDAAGGAHSVAMNVAVDGLSASYTTVAGDLPEPASTSSSSSSLLVLLVRR